MLLLRRLPPAMSPPSASAPDAVVRHRRTTGFRTAVMDPRGCYVATEVGLYAFVGGEWIGPWGDRGDAVREVAVASDGAAVVVVDDQGGLEVWPVPDETRDGARLEAEVRERTGLHLGDGRVSARIRP